MSVWTNLLKTLEQRSRLVSIDGATCPGCTSPKMFLDEKTMTTFCRGCGGRWTPAVMRQHLERVDSENAARDRESAARAATQQRADRFAAKPNESTASRLETLAAFAGRLRELGANVPGDLASIERSHEWRQRRAAESAGRPAARTAEEIDRDRRYQELRSRAGLFR